MASLTPYFSSARSANSFPLDSRQLFHSDADRFWEALRDGLRVYPQAQYITIPNGSKIPRPIIEAMIDLGFWVDPQKIDRFIGKLELLDIHLETYEDEGFTPLHLAAIAGRSLDVEPASHYYNVNELDRKGRTALHFAAFFGHLEVAKCIIYAGAHHDLGTPGNGTPQDFAIMGNEPHLAAYFSSLNIYAKKQSKFTDYQLSWINGTPHHLPRDAKDLSEFATALCGIKHKRKEDAFEKFSQVIAKCQNPELFKSYYKSETLLRRVYHAWKIDWNPGRTNSGLSYRQKIFFQYNSSILSTTPIGGGFSSYFLRKMEKATRQFNEFLSRPSKNDVACLCLLEETLHVSDPKNGATATDLLSRWRKNRPIIVAIRFAHHVCTALVWGKFFILCNRGKGYRKPIEVFFCNKPLQSAILTRLMSGFVSKKDSEDEEEEEYNTFMFDELPELLGMRKTNIEHDLEKMWELPLQSIGNCAWESVETSAFAFMMLYSLRRNRLISLHTYSRRTAESLCSRQRRFFGNWLLFQQVTILEKYLKRLSDETPRIMTNKDMLPELKEKVSKLVPQKWIYPKLRTKLHAISFPCYTKA